MSKSAVVIGAGIAGLTAARVLSESFDRVTIIERDFLGVQGQRRGVAQSRHLHVLLRRGRLVLEELFPGLDGELEESGAPEVDWSLDTAWLSRFGWFPRYRSGILTRSCSRGLLEDKVRARVLSRPGVVAVERQEVKDLDVEGSRVRAVRCGSLRIPADLVVDAAGRMSRLSAGRSAQVVDASVAYASCVMEIPSQALREFKQLYVQMRPPEVLRGGVLIPLEGGAHMVTLVGAGGERPPTDERGFLDFARSLHDPAFHSTIRDARALSPIFAYGQTRGHRAGSRSDLPGNLLSMGDSYCSFNPVYGQGMTVAALSALALREELKSSAPNRRSFQGRLASLTSIPWQMAASEDFRVRAVETENFGAVSRYALRAFPRVTDAVIRRAVEEPMAHLRFLKVLHLLDGPGSLLKVFV